ncbi:hypothetical protein M8C21_022984 [Ambrosia artemisiifolia]|uniref:Uncharacterized protein n=1 Tax=Ambrosia artemisiifolia TaxID=4212 RepID=A0AAD5C8E5_AMBAR|nr:hypothetical protein M8C21_022984 [Ambrosia artemisiifolia]
MNTLGWMQKRFWNNNGQSTNDSTGKSYSCFSALWKLDEQQHYHEANNNSAQLKQPVAVEAHGVEIVNEEEIVGMNPKFLHGFLAIGTLGSVMITKDLITPEPAIYEEESSAGEQILNKLENITEKELKKDTKENKNTVVYPLKEYYEMPAKAAIKEEEKEQKAMLERTFKKITTTNKRSGKADRGVKKETKVSQFMKKMLKKLDFASSCSTPAFRSNTICDSTKKTPTKVFWKSRKIHPEAANIHVNNSHTYEVKKMCNDKVTSDDEDDMYHQDPVFKKETISSKMVAHRPFPIQPTGSKAHWIKTDADCKFCAGVLEAEKWAVNSSSYPILARREVWLCA